MPSPDAVLRGKAPTIQILAALRTEPVLQALESALRSLGFVVAELTEVRADVPVLAPTVVVLSDELVASLGGAELAQRSLSLLGAQAIPITCGNQAYGKLMGDLSQIPVGSFGVNRAARRIQLLASVDRKSIGTWNRLQASAVRWDLDGRPSAALLSRSGLREAQGLLTQPISELPGANSRAVTSYTTASAVRLRRIRSRTILGSLVVSAILICASIVATTQRSAAVESTTRANKAASAAEADRLANISSSTLSSDPDLPWIVAAHSVQTAPTASSLDAARQVLSQQVPHKSFRLQAPATSLAVLPDHLVAAGFAFGAGHEIFDTESGKAVLEVSGSDADSIDYVAASPDRKRVIATSDGHRTEIITLGDSLARKTVVGPQPTGPANWLDSDTVISTGDQGFVVIDATRGTSRILPTPIGDSGVDPANLSVSALSPDGKWIAGATRTMVGVWRLGGTGENVRLVGSSRGSGPVQTVPAASTTNLVTIPAHDGAGPHLLIDENRKVKIVDLGAVLAGRPVADETTLISTNAGAEAVMPNGSVYIGLPNGMVQVIESGADYAVTTTIAHTGAATAIASSADGRWATGGADSMLRIWDRPITEAVAPSESSAFGESTVRRYQLEGSRESNRVTMGAAVGSPFVSIAVPSIGKIVTIDRAKMLRVAENSTGLPAPGARLKLARTTATTAVEISQLMTKDNLLVLSLSPSPHWLMYDTLSEWSVFRSIVGVADDGSAVAVASSRGFALWPTTNDAAKPQSVKATSSANPVYVRAYSARSAIDIGTDGRITSIGGPTSKLDTEGRQLVAAASDRPNHFVTVDEDGTVREHELSTTRTVGQIPTTFGYYAMVLSSDCRYVAAIGAGGTVVLDLKTGRNLALIKPLDIVTDEFPVDDVLFDEDGKGFLAARSNGWVQHIDLLDSQQITHGILKNEPRGFDSTEKLAFGIARNVGTGS